MSDVSMQLRIVHITSSQLMLLREQWAVNALLDNLPTLAETVGALWTPDLQPTITILYFCNNLVHSLTACSKRGLPSTSWITLGSGYLAPRRLRALLGARINCRTSTTIVSNLGIFAVILLYNFVFNPMDRTKYDSWRGVTSSSSRNSMGPCTVSSGYNSGPVLDWRRLSSPEYK